MLDKLYDIARQPYHQATCPFGLLIRELVFPKLLKRTQRQPQLHSATRRQEPKKKNSSPPSLFLDTAHPPCASHPSPSCCSEQRLLSRSPTPSTTATATSSPPGPRMRTPPNEMYAVRTGSNTAAANAGGVTTDAAPQVQTRQNKRSRSELAIWGRWYCEARSEAVPSRAPGWDRTRKTGCMDVGRRGRWTAAVVKHPTEYYSSIACTVCEEIMTINLIRRRVKKR
ncbi:uncharacterized protein UV8b_05822 [Ustilaginoidea virens]|uniref:Uncharacterized protein n=1 Tax=Ustilaginoidea virens TaxID=1159556 RepID=A0A8E5HU39_USTVR|nr:uncharacterized protein UV8b_05822 [Ustilaginoidea virens]QUC21579.1 hypothetical protein UV8b_05822 [Ustilaginoidea virens]